MQFQSQAGFVPLCDSDSFWSPRVLHEFQSQAGFVPLCDLHDVLVAYALSMFQSQAGFVPLCDCSRRLAHDRVIWCFNPRRDLFLFATLRHRCYGAMCTAVSIPGGICSSLRPQRSSYMDACSLRFNPRRDLFLFATDVMSVTFIRLLSIEHSCFNPRRDLFLFATRRAVNSPMGQSDQFQSQAGFVPLCDRHRRLVSIDPLIDVSIPGGICSSLRHSASHGSRHCSQRFQSQAGFVPLCDEQCVNRHGRSLQCFNPRRDLFLFAT